MSNKLEILKNEGANPVMFEQSRVLLGSFPKTVLMETDRFKVMTVKKVSVCYYSIVDKETNKRNIYRKTISFERALKKNNIDKELLLENMQKIMLESISALDKEDLTKEDIDFFSIKKALYRSDVNEEILIAKNDVRSLILKNTESGNYFEMLFYIRRGNRKILTARTEVGCTEMFKMAKRENLHIEEIINKLQSLLLERYEKITREN